MVDFPLSRRPLTSSVSDAGTSVLHEQEEYGSNAVRTSNVEDVNKHMGEQEHPLLVSSTGRPGRLE
jgi:hypothetical protein